MTTVEKLYQDHIQMLSAGEQLRLITLVAQSLSTSALPQAKVEPKPHPAYSTKQYSMMELHGLGAEVWQGIDAQAYVDELRNEWDRTALR